jgi:DNA-binding transcriptional MerR regulator
MDEWSIQEVAKITGTTSRTLRHYGDVGLLPAARIGHNGYRYYDRESLVRLQRILLLRELGLGLPAIAEVMARPTDIASALRTHIGWLRQERDRLDRQVAAIERTLAAMEEGRRLTVDTMFDGFDHTQYREEVEQRWGADAYHRSNTWWESKTAAEKREWQRDTAERSRAWTDLAASGADPAGVPAQALAEGHVAWLRSVPGTPATDPASIRAYVLGLADMYVADPRFAANYGGESGATFVREALTHYAEAHL